MPRFPAALSGVLVNGLPDGVERVEYEVNLDACPELIVASSPTEFQPPAG
jgi:hypothetical protein